MWTTQSGCRVHELAGREADFGRADIKAYDAVYKRFIAGTNLHDVSSSFAMERLKYTTALPLKYVS